MSVSKDSICAICKGQLAEAQAIHDAEAKPKGTRSRKPKVEPKVTKVQPKVKGELDFGKLRVWASEKLIWAPKQAYAVALIDALEAGKAIPPRPGDLPESAAHKVELRLKVTR